MKRIQQYYFLLALPLCISCSAYKHPVKNIYAYKQESIPGTLLKHYDENGNEVYEERNISFNYWFYIETRKDHQVIPQELWISGKHFTLNTEMIPQTPVEKIIYTATPGPDTITMVPLTKNKVMLIYPTGLAHDPAAEVPSGKKDSELVIGYTWKGKKYFAGVKKIAILEPEIHP